MIEQELIDALKVQVNYLRRELIDTNAFLEKAGVADYIVRDIEKALQETPEQCLAEVKTKAINEYKQQLAEQRQLDLATKIMTVTV